MNPRGVSDDLITLAEFAELAGMGKSGLVMARNRGGDFPSAVQDERGRLLYDRQEAEAWVEARAARKANAPSKRVRKDVAAGARNVVKAAYLTMLESERRRGVVLPDDLPPQALAARAQMTVRGDRALAGWLDDVLCGPLTEWDVLGLKELDVLVQQTPPQKLAALLEELLTGAVSVDSDGRPILDEAGTPLALVELMGSLAGPATRGVLDPAAGVGSLLLDAPGVSPNTPLYAFEINFESAVIARCRAYFRGRDLEVIGTDALNAGSPWLHDGAVDRVLCHAPFGMSRENQGIDLKFAVRAVDQVVAGATAVLLVSMSSLRSPRTRDLRRRLLDSGMLRVVIAIPPIPGTRSRIDAALLVLTSRCEQPDGEILFVDARPVRQPGPKARATSPVSHSDLVRRTRGWLNGDSDLESGTYGLANGTTIRASQQSLLLPADYILPERDQITESELRTTIAGIEASLAVAQHYVREIAPALGQDAFQLETVADLRKQGVVSVVSGFRVRDIALTPIPAEGTPESHTPVITQQSIRHSGTLKPVEMLPTDHVARARRTQPGDVIFSTYGSRLALVDTEGGHVITTPLQILRCQTAKVNPHLAAETLRSELTTRRITTSTIERLDIGSLLLPVAIENSESEAFIKSFTRLLALRGQLEETRQHLDELIDTLTRATHNPPSPPNFNSQESL